MFISDVFTLKKTSYIIGNKNEVVCLYCQCYVVLNLDNQTHT